MQQVVIRLSPEPAEEVQVRRGLNNGKAIARQKVVIPVQGADLDYVALSGLKEECFKIHGSLGSFLK